jgi:RimJ/RimL family protein N-acetyltransferase
MSSFDRVVLAGSHVRLEPLSLDHVDALLRAATESRKTYNLTLVPDSRLLMRAYVERVLAEEARGESLSFAVRTSAGEVVGATRLTGIEWWTWPCAPPEPLPIGPDALEIGGTWYAERVQRTAVNTETMLLLCTHAFETMRVRRILWRVDARNARAREAILRLGANSDGILRAQRPGVDGAIMDSACYSMLHAEWPAAKPRLVAKLAKGSAR